MQRHLLTTAQAAELAHVTVDAIRHAINRGYLPASKIGRDWFIHPADLDDYIEGRPDWYAERVTRRSQIAHTPAD